MKIVLFLASLVVCLLQGEACRDGWIRFRNNCYLFSRDRAPWGDSAAVCAAFHSHLAIITSAEDNAFMKSEIQNFNTGGGTGVAYWIDGTDIEVENIWRWTSSGEKVSFFNWGTGQPNNGHASNCMSLYGGLSFNMADEHCDTSYNYICQMSDADASELIG